MAEQQFWAELKILGTFFHPNLLPVLGACTESDRPMCLVYPFMGGRSLHSRLHQRQPGDAELTASQRLQIVIGAARGLAYLHSRTHSPWVVLDSEMAPDRKPVIIHRDVKTDNSERAEWARQVDFFPPARLNGPLGILTFPPPQSPKRTPSLHQSSSTISCDRGWPMLGSPGIWLGRILMRL